MRMPPPLVEIVGLVLWLKMIVLCSMSPFQANPSCAMPPPSPTLRFPHTQLFWSLYLSEPVVQVIPPAPAGVAESSSSPVEELSITALWWMLTFRLWQYGSCVLVSTDGPGKVDVP